VYIYIHVLFIHTYFIEVCTYTHIYKSYIQISHMYYSYIHISLSLLDVCIIWGTAWVHHRHMYAATRLIDTSMYVSMTSVCICTHFCFSLPHILSLLHEIFMHMYTHINDTHMHQCHMCVYVHTYVFIYTHSHVCLTRTFVVYVCA